MEAIEMKTHRYMQVSSTVETITPKMAEAYLASQTRNRPLSTHVLEMLRRSLRDGHWQLTHQGIAFDVNGHLIDGQHRLSAIIAENATVDMFVTRGLPSTAFQVVDRGRMRKARDVLAIEGYKRTSELGSALLMEWQFVQSGGTDPTKKSYTHPDINDLLELAEQRPLLVELSQRDEVIPTLAGGLRNRPYPGGVGLWLFFHAVRNSTLADAWHFFEGIVEGDSLAKNSPELMLRNRLLSMNLEIANKRRSHGRVTDLERVALTIKAYKAFLAGNEVKNLRWSPTTEGVPQLSPRKLLEEDERKRARK